MSTSPGRRANSPDQNKPPRSKLRCAIYTRKSHEEGLEQEFNSLNAQREACEAYIVSQRQEGWTVLPTFYDDGGISGATMQRPALQRLLTDIADGKIDVVVVYKVDRLTRSLADFAKIVEIFDAKQVSFVSVTQAFNTTSSMGRLTLNVLLSFAQFEREVTGERIRDKIAASKRKGMWMGGLPPLGYDVKERKLVVNETEAQTVRHIFDCYRDLKSVRLLQLELAAEGIVSKIRPTANDAVERGGKPLARGALYLMLANRIYRGEITHKGDAYPAEHPPIVEQDLWDEVQSILTDNRVRRERGTSAQAPSLLAGLVFDADGNRLTPSHAVKRGTRYRYYISQSLTTSSLGDAKQPSKNAKTGWRIPAPALEGLIKDQIVSFLASPTRIMDALAEAAPDAAEAGELIQKAAETARSIERGTDDLLRQFLMATVIRITVQASVVDLKLDRDALLGWLTHNDALSGPAVSLVRANHGDPIHLAIPASLRRSGNELRFVVAGEKGRDPDQSLIRIIVRAHTIAERFAQEDGLTIEEVALQEKLTPSYITRLLRLTYLAPDILTRILDGDQPPELTAAKLMADTRLPLDWQEQRIRLGIAA
ncbi:recombinase family protein [Microvirga sp. 2YAF29]|uniref:recombinase family protein n=1 Tax=Microvirga sp. 2YAF29 TaxID=3233031 RepID=UPI003F998F53